MPNSILWIGLVVLWVFVLFPMLANRHPRIRQHTDAALSTRVLHRGGAKRSTRKGPATGHDTDPDYVPVRRKLHPSEDPEDRMTRSDDSPAEPEALTAAVAAETAAAVAEKDEVVAAVSAELPEPETDSTDPEDADDADADAAESEPAAAESETDPETATDETESETVDAAAETDDAEPEVAVADAAAAEPRKRASRAPALRDPEPEPELESDDEDEDEDFVPSRRGRGGFDPEADAAARAARYTFRQRAVLGLVLAVLLFAASGLAISSILWWLSALSGTVLVAYLAYLRKQVRLEEDIRRRRAARAARKQTESDAEDERRTRERPRPDRDETRTQLRRAVLVESDDEDPFFEHLDLFDAAEARATRQRAAGARERRAVGE
ncbi:gephyrin-like molybdotransferase receptor GlpR [Nocardia sp. NPDC059764]|uniref:divisome protein SepX/GlpR n=1 Tax=Nocardia sp. NPDC059764 TaxID=3346939 RepID=UPI0036466602